MSRSRFMPLPFRHFSTRVDSRAGPVVSAPAPLAGALPRPPGWRPRRRGGPGRRSPELTPPAGPPFLALAADPDLGQGNALAEALLARVCRPGPVAGAVIVDLGPAAEFDQSAAAALCSVRDMLRRSGARLLVVAASRQGRDQLATLGPPRLGAEAIHASLRSAVLAAYAALPGPGLVTSDIRAALARPPEPLSARPARGEDSRAVSASPAEGGAAPAAGWWTECSPGSTA